MKRMKIEKGITLITLIITIVILIILAAVVLFDNDAIIGHAKNEAERYNKAQEESNRNLEDYVDYLKNEMNYDENCEHLFLKVSYLAHESAGTHDYVKYCSVCKYIMETVEDENCSLVKVCVRKGDGADHFYDYMCSKCNAYKGEENPEGCDQTDSNPGNGYCDFCKWNANDSESDNDDENDGEGNVEEEYCVCDYPTDEDIYKDGYCDTCGKRIEGVEIPCSHDSISSIEYEQASGRSHYKIEYCEDCGGKIYNLEECSPYYGICDGCGNENENPS